MCNVCLNTIIANSWQINSFWSVNNTYALINQKCFFTWWFRLDSVFLAWQNDDIFISPLSSNIDIRTWDSSLGILSFKSSDIGCVRFMTRLNIKFVSRTIILSRQFSHFDKIYCIKFVILAVSQSELASHELLLSYCRVLSTFTTLEVISSNTYINYSGCSSASNRCIVISIFFRFFHYLWQCGH